MRNIASCAITLLMLMLGHPLAALAQADQCPAGFSNDECDRWQFERADRQLSELVLREISELGKWSTDSRWQEEAKELLIEAQRTWEAFRTAECKARSTINVISARTLKAKNSACLLALTQRRIAEIKH